MEDFENFNTEQEKSLLSRCKKLESQMRLDNAVPSFYRVELTVNEKTPHDMVVFILEDIFHKKPSEIKKLTKSASLNKTIDCGTYTMDVAYTKQVEVIQLAQDNGFKINCKIHKDKKNVVKKS